MTRIREVTEQRKVIVGAIGPQEESFSVVSYNILADCWVLPEWYSYTPSDCRTSMQRHDKLMTELEVLAGDIVCLQEVGVEYQSFLEKELEKRGYSGEYCRHIQQGDGQGDATYFRKDKFESLEVHMFSFNQMLEEAVEADGQDKAILGKCQKDEMFHILKLKHLKTGKVLTIGNIHTIWEKFTELDVSALHIALSLAKLAKCADDSTFIIAGDFNSPPHLAPYSLLQTGHIPNSHKPQMLTTLPGRSLYQKLSVWYSHKTPDLASSYQTVLAREPDVTVYNDADGTYLLETCLDYIWYTSSTLTVASVVNPSQPANLLPDNVYPSDHLSLKATFFFKELTQD